MRKRERKRERERVRETEGERRETDVIYFFNLTCFNYSLSINFFCFMNLGITIVPK